jgi:hypothetical protein
MIERYATDFIAENMQLCERACSPAGVRRNGPKVTGRCLLQIGLHDNPCHNSWNGGACCYITGGPGMSETDVLSTYSAVLAGSLRAKPAG